MKSLTKKGLLLLAILINTSCVATKNLLEVIEDYSGTCCPLNRGIKTFFTSPCTEEPRIRLQKGEFILATRGLRYVTENTEFLLE